MDERYENDYENTANQWEETDNGERVTYREARTQPFSGEEGAPQRRPVRRAAGTGEGRERKARSYQPAGTRTYRTDSRPGASRPSRAARSGAAEAALNPSYGQLAMLGVLVLLVIISIIMGIASCASGGGAKKGDSAVDTSALTNAAANVEAAEKTVDENGIVHGKTADGTRFTIVNAKQGASPAATTAAASDSAAAASGDAAGASAAAESASAAAESDSAAAESSSESASESASEAVSGSVSVAEAGASTSSDAADGDGQQDAVAGSESSSSVAGATSTAKEKVSFAAVGDQVASDQALELADSYAGTKGDGTYDFKPFYQEVKPFLQTSTLRYISQATPVIGGQEGYEVSANPNYISPEACLDAIVDTGFNMVNFNSDHSYDAGTEGIEYTQKALAKYPQIVAAGTYTSKDERETVHMIEDNGIRFAFLSYSLGDSNYEDVSKEPNNYYAVPFVKDDAAADIARAKQVADCIVVAMHWGDENSTELNADQKDWAQWLADQDVDLVLGTHAHNIQPVQYFTGTAGNKVPIVFGLGDFVSGGTATDSILSGIFTCDFVRQDTGRVSVENPQWHPTIEWSDGTGQTYVRMLEAMTVAQINANKRTEDVSNSFKHVYDLTNTIITQVPVAWGSDADEKAEAAGSGAAGTAAGAAAAKTSGHVDEDGDGYDDETDEWIGDDEDADADADEEDADEEDADEDAGGLDEDGDGYDDETGEWLGVGEEDADYDDGTVDDEADDETYADGEEDYGEDDGEDVDYEDEGDVEEEE